MHVFQYLPRHTRSPRTRVSMRQTCNCCPAANVKDSRTRPRGKVRGTNNKKRQAGQQQTQRRSWTATVGSRAKVLQSQIRCRLCSRRMERLLMVLRARKRLIRGTQRVLLARTVCKNLLMRRMLRSFQKQMHLFSSCKSTRRRVTMTESLH